MKGFVGVTDNDWFRFLASRPGMDEVNFWQPSGGRQFRSLDVGEPFLFKLHHPENYIVGGGFFAGYVQVPSKTCLGRVRREERSPNVRRHAIADREIPPGGARTARRYTIGCILLQAPFFFDGSDWIPAPPDFKKNIVQGKGYDLERGVGRELWEAVRDRLSLSHTQASGEPPPVCGDPILVKQKCEETEPVISLIGMALLRSGWSSDVALLNQPCLVVKL